MDVCSTIVYMEVSSRAYATGCNKFADNEMSMPTTSARVFSSCLVYTVFEDCLVQQRMLLRIHVHVYSLWMSADIILGDALSSRDCISKQVIPKVGKFSQLKNFCACFGG